MEYAGEYTLNNYSPYQPLSRPPNESLNVYTLFPSPTINSKSNTISIDNNNERNLDEIYIEEEDEYCEECFNPLISNYLNNRLYIQVKPEIYDEEKMKEIVSSIIECEYLKKEQEFEGKMIVWELKSEDNDVINELLSEQSINIEEFELYFSSSPKFVNFTLFLLNIPLNINTIEIVKIITKIISSKSITKVYRNLKEYYKCYIQFENKDYCLKCMEYDEFSLLKITTTLSYTIYNDFKVTNGENQIPPASNSVSNELYSSKSSSSTDNQNVVNNNRKEDASVNVKSIKQKEKWVKISNYTFTCYNGIYSYFIASVGMISRIMYDGNNFYIKYNNDESCSKCKRRFDGKSLRNKPLHIEVIEIEDENEINEWIEITKKMNSLGELDKKLQQIKQSKISTVKNPNVSTPTPSSTPAATVFTKSNINIERPISQPKPASSPSAPSSVVSQSTSKNTKWYIITNYKENNDTEYLKRVLNLYGKVIEMKYDNVSDAYYVLYETRKTIKYLNEDSFFSKKLIINLYYNMSIISHPKLINIYSNNSSSSSSTSTSIVSSPPVKIERNITTSTETTTPKEKGSITKYGGNWCKVTNFHFGNNLNDIKSYFSPAGRIMDIVNKPEYILIKFESNEKAKRCVTRFNKGNYKGEKVTVEIYNTDNKDEKSFSKTVEREWCILYDFKTKDEFHDIMSNFCGCYCDIKVTRIKRNNNVYYLQYNDYDEVTTAIEIFNNKMICGNIIKLQYYDGEEEPTGIEIINNSESFKNIPIKPIYSSSICPSDRESITKISSNWCKVTNFHCGNNLNDIKSYFSPAGRIMDIVNKPEYILIKFESNEKAKRCVTRFNKGNYKGEKVTVEIYNTDNKDEKLSLSIKKNEDLMSNNPQSTKEDVLTGWCILYNFKTKDEFHDIMSNFCGRNCRLTKIKKYNNVYYLQYNNYYETSFAIKCFNNTVKCKNVIKLQHYYSNLEPPGIEIINNTESFRKERINSINTFISPSTHSPSYINPFGKDDQFLSDIHQPINNYSKWIKVSNYSFTTCSQINDYFSVAGKIIMILYYAYDFYIKYDDEESSKKCLRYFNCREYNYIILKVEIIERLDERVVKEGVNVSAMLTYTK